jgi:D-glycero-D-manno-heptose 1,7-bisphosphate phosphatase
VTGEPYSQEPRTPERRAQDPRRGAFLDRDGVINIDHGYVSRIADFAFVPGVQMAAAELSRAGYELVVVTNQAGIGRGMYTEADFSELTVWMVAQFAQAGVPIAGVYHCPHHPTLALGALRRACDCRKPAPGMLLDAARDLRLALSGSVMFGDKCDDMRAARAAGVGTRVYLGKDGRAPPEEACEDAGAGLRYASLAQAVADPALRRLLGLGCNASTG